MAATAAGQGGVLTCGYSCTALRNYFKLWRTAEVERDWEVRHVSRWPAAGSPPSPLPPAGREIGEKKETLMLFPLLSSFSHFSSVFPFASATRLHSIPLYTPPPLPPLRLFLPYSLRFFIFALLRLTIFIPLASLTLVSLFFSSLSLPFPSCFLFFCLLKLFTHFLHCLSCFLFFILVYYLTQHFHTHFVSLLQFLSF